MANEKVLTCVTLVTSNYLSGGTRGFLTRREGADCVRTFLTQRGVYSDRDREYLRMFIEGCIEGVQLHTDGYSIGVGQQEILSLT